MVLSFEPRIVHSILNNNQRNDFDLFTWDDIKQQAMANSRLSKRPSAVISAKSLEREGEKKNNNDQNKKETILTKSFEEHLLVDLIWQRNPLLVHLFDEKEKAFFSFFSDHRTCEVTLHWTTLLKVRLIPCSFIGTNSPIPYRKIHFTSIDLLLFLPAMIEILLLSHIRNQYVWEEEIRRRRRWKEIYIYIERTNVRE